MRVLLADDHRLVRAGLRALLDELDGVQVVAEAADGGEAVERVLEFSPTIALLDIAMPRLSGIGALQRIRAAGSATKVVLLSMHEDIEYVGEAMRAGAAGYVIKDAAVEELALALQAVARGDHYTSPRISHKLAGAFASRTGIAPALTARQTEILRLVAQGLSSKEIARSLDLSVKTVETHRTQIMERLMIHDLAGLVRYAVRTGIVDASD